MRREREGKIVGQLMTDLGHLAQETDGGERFDPLCLHLDAKYWIFL